MRLIYENTETRANERETSKRLEEKWSCGLVKLPRHYVMDYAAVRNDKVVSFVEIKCRTNAMEHYPTYMVAAHKPLKANELYMTFRLPSFLVVQWTDALGYVDFQKAGYDLRIGGRKDRNDPADQEPVLHIPVERFDVVEEKETPWP